MTYKLLGQQEVSRTKAGGSAIEGIRLVCPTGTNLVKWYCIVTGVAAAIRCNGTPRWDVLTDAGTFTTALGPGHADSYFNLGGIPVPALSLNEKAYVQSANRFEWGIQANAVTENKFFLRVKFYQRA